MSSEPPPTAFQTSAVLNKEHEPTSTPTQAAEPTGSSDVPAAAPTTTTEKPTTEPTGTETSTATETIKDVPKGSAVVEAQPITEGVMGYKAPGFPKSLIYSKKFFWLSDEPVQSSSLSSYVSNEKADVGHRNAAHASQTGKGLLFFAKRAEDKNHPAGILNLVEVSDVARGDFNDFSFKLHGHKHSFQTPTKAERDGWLVAIETKSKEARAAHEDLISSQGYKSQLEKYAKPTHTPGNKSNNIASRSRSRANKSSPKPVENTTQKTAEPAAATPAEATSTSTAPATTTTESKAVEAVAPATVAADTTRSTGSSSDEATTKGKSKSRSESGKRSSIFGTLLGKKEDHDSKKEAKKEEKEEKKEIKKEEKAEQKEIKREQKAEDKAITKETKEEENAEKAAEKEEAKTEISEATHSTGASGLTHAEEIAARVVGAPLATQQDGITTAPTETLPGTTGASAVTKTTEGTPTSPVTESKEVTSPTTGTASSKTNKRGSIFSNFFGKKESQSPVTETTPAVPSKETEPSGVSAAAPQLEDPVKSTETDTSVTSEPTAVPNETTAATTEPTAPVAESATTPEATKPNRRSSFFNNLGSKKERKSDLASESENTDGEGKKSSKLGGLFRKPSRATSRKTSEKAAEKPAANPAPVAETSEAPAVDSTEAPTTASADPALAAGVSKVDQPAVDPVAEKAVNGETSQTSQTPAITAT